MSLATGTARKVSPYIYTCQMSSQALERLVGLCEAASEIRQVTAPNGKPGYAGHPGISQPLGSVPSAYFHFCQAIESLVQALATKRRVFQIEDPCILVRSISSSSKIRCPLEQVALRMSWLKCSRKRQQNTRTPLPSSKRHPAVQSAFLADCRSCSLLTVRGWPLIGGSHFVVQ